MEDVSLTLVNPEDRKGDGSLLPATRERVTDELEMYLTKKQKGNINFSELSRQSGLNQATIQAILKEITEKWREEDQGKYSILRRAFLRKLDTLVEDLGTADHLTASKLKELVGLVKDIKGLDEAQNPNVQMTDNSQVINFHFEDTKLSPAAVEELQKTRERKQAEVIESKDANG